MMTKPVASLLDLQQLGPDHFRAPSAAGTGDRVYGGQLLGQALSAGRRCVTDDRIPQSLHAYFMRAGDPDTPFEIHVERVRDGRSFSQRSVRTLQHGKEVFRALISFHVPEPGLQFDARVIPDVPPPEDVSFTYIDFIEAMPDRGPLPSRDLRRSMDIRYINPPSASREPIFESQKMWMRTTEDFEADWNDHHAALAFLSDSTVIDHVMLPHGRRWHDHDLEGTSLDHAMWFHRKVRADEWLLYDQSAEWTGGSRGLSRGSIFDQKGRLVATCVQEGLIRLS